MDAVIETPRLTLSKIKWKNYQELCGILGDAQVMYAWEHAFTREEVEEWVEENLRRYQSDGYSYLAVTEKASGNLAGVCGLIKETAAGQEYLGIGYIFHKDFWGKGYASESARACMDYAFRQLKAEELTAQIRPENQASRKVAEGLGMREHSRFIKEYRGKEMSHILYKVYNNN